MTKIKPITNIAKTAIESIKPSAKNTTNIITKPYEIGTTAIGATGITISTFLQDYNKTANEENYFQFKINPKTGKPFKPDIFQTASGMNLYLGNDVLVTAPTGTGKTAIAEYIITKNLKEGGRTFYTTPLKALSNEKFLDFSNIYGKENVGLLTGDTKINTEAPIIIMTTEVYRNMAASGKFNFNQDNTKGIPENVKTVIFDELQYLGDIDRGGIWEQSIMFTPRNIQILSLSATIGNNEEINNWIASVKGRKGSSVTPDKTYKAKNNDIKETILINVPSENRHVPLSFEHEHAAAEIKIPRGATKAEKRKAKQDGARISQSIYAKPRDEAYKNLTRKLFEENKLPAIYFVFSKKDCRHLLKYLSAESSILTNDHEQKEIEKIIEKYKKEGIYLGETINYDALKKGYAIHNAGFLPSQKRLVEELFQKKLVKVVLATETLAAGINMPARTTVISSPRKPASTSDGGDDKKRNLTANEFHQMAGRAGRRGIDTEGFCYAISCNGEQRKLYENLINSPSNALESNLNLDFSFIANYMAEFISQDELRYILSKSLFAYNPEGKIDNNKLDNLIKDFNAKKKILENNNFINNGKLSTKGYLIKLLNGYEQIPIINIIHDKLFTEMNPVQIAGILGGLANIDYSIKDDFPEKPFELKNQKDIPFSVAAKNVFESIKKYAKEIEELHPDRELKIEPKIMEHLYSWANLNSRNLDSKNNWKELFSGELRYSIKDEGCLFKEIVMTSDLIKQLIEVAEEGANISGNSSEQKYYDNLAAKLKEALTLIQKEPANNTF